MSASECLSACGCHRVVCTSPTACLSRAPRRGHAPPGEATPPGVATPRRAAACMRRADRWPLSADRTRPAIACLETLIMTESSDRVG
ncbi:unnamed protein product [Merluccius merluccius]